MHINHLGHLTLRSKYTFKSNMPSLPLRSMTRHYPQADLENHSRFL